MIRRATVSIPLVGLAAVALTGAIAAGGCAMTPYGAPVAATVQGDPAETGYLSAARLTVLARAVPAPPAEGSPAQIADRAVSERYRLLEDTDRWLLATAHAELSPELARQHFDCALGVRFAATPTPGLTALLEKVLHDAETVADTVKARDYRPRPVAFDPQRRACTRLGDAGRASPSYPSGSAAVGVAYGEVLARLDPGQAAAAREIGRQIAVSRLVCGMHYPADAAAGETVGRVVMAEIAATPAFQTDLADARQELAAVRATGLTNPGCAAERAALAMTLP